MPEEEEESKTYRYVRTFSVETRERAVTNMDKEELQEYINQLLGAKGLDNKTKENASN